MSKEHNTLFELFSEHFKRPDSHYILWEFATNFIIGCDEGTESHRDWDVASSGISEGSFWEVVAVVNTFSATGDVPIPGHH